MDSASTVETSELPLRRTLGFQLCCWFLAVGLLPLAITSGVLYYLTRAETLRLVEAELVARSARHLSFISESLAQHEEALTLLARSGISADALDSLTNLLETKGVASPEFEAQLALKRRQLTNSAETFQLADIYLVNPAGMIVFSLRSREELGSSVFKPPYQDTELGKVVTRTLTLMGVENSEYNYYPPTNEPAVFMAAPVHTDNVLHGFAVIELNQRQIEHIARDSSFLGKTGETVIFSARDGAAEIVAPTRFDPTAAFRRTVSYTDPGGDIVKRVVDGYQGSGLTTDYRGRRVLAQWKFLPSFRWGIMVKMDADEAFVPVRNLRNLTLVICSLTALAVLLIAFTIARGITSPLKALAEFTKVIAAGNFTKQVQVASRNEIGRLATSVNDMVRGLKERETVKTAFARYVSHQILDSVIESGQVPEVKGERRRITALFSDIRGFTALSEQLSSEEVVSILNDYFEKMVRIVFRNNGTIDKFIGDGLMVVFGAPVADPDQEKNAVTAAVEMQREVTALRAKWLAEKNITIKIGIGINSGPATVGNIGSSERLEYTAIGDTVNLASRLQTATKEVGFDILISASTASAIGNTFDVIPHGTITIRGKTLPVQVFEVRHETAFKNS